MSLIERLTYCVSPDTNLMVLASQQAARSTPAASLF